MVMASNGSIYIYLNESNGCISCEESALSSFPPTLSDIPVTVEVESKKIKHHKTELILLANQKSPDGTNPCSTRASEEKFECKFSTKINSSRRFARDSSWNGCPWRRNLL